MNANGGKRPVISLSDGFSRVVVQGTNIRVEIFADDNVFFASPNGAMRAIEIGASGNTALSAMGWLKVGARMPDGTIYAGISPDTAMPMYTTRKDSGFDVEWDEAMDHAANFGAHGHRDWRVPTKAELKVLFKNHVAIGGFGPRNSRPGWYWSSLRRFYGTWTQHFGDNGYGVHAHKHHVSSLRCVRG
jgi:hypothetical protein